MLNARYLTKLGYGRWAASLTEAGVMKRFLCDLPAYEHALAGYHQDGNSELLAALDEQIDRAAAGLI